jgi:hypothetical protein
MTSRVILPDDDSWTHVTCYVPVLYTRAHSMMHSLKSYNEIYTKCKQNYLKRNLKYWIVIASYIDVDAC